ncbi:MAG: glycosyltransferase family 2 protein [Bacillota bacterium]
MKVSAVIPAYNEEKTVAEVVRVLRSMPEITEVIVVSDGSEDGTAAMAREAGAVVIELPENTGKGGAMMVGAEHTREDVLLFMDADLIGLQKEHIYDLITPVIFGEAQMTVGIFDSGRPLTDLAFQLAPQFSGQRAVLKGIFKAICHLEATRFGVELALNRHAARQNLVVREVVMHQMTHIMKEEKLGLARGLVARAKMYWEIAQWAIRQ